MRTCDYYKPRDKTAKVNCLNCTNWAGKRSRCAIEKKVLNNDKTDLVHESCRPAPRRGIIGVLR